MRGDRSKWVVWCFSLGLGCAWSGSAMSGVEVDKVDGGKIYLRSPAGEATYPPVETNLFGVEGLGTLVPPEGPPYLLISGMQCADCKESRSLHLLRTDGKNPRTFTYPGVIRDRKTRAIVFEGQAFFGKCLDAVRDVLVIFQREKIDRRRFLQGSVLVAEVQKDRVEERLISRRAPKIQSTERLVKKGICREVAGLERLTGQP